MSDNVGDPAALHRSEGRAQGLREAADQVHAEARWQQELRERGQQPPDDWTWHIARLEMLEGLLTQRAEHT